MPRESTPPDSSTDVAPFYSGRWAILAIAGTALGMTGFAWWYWYSIGDRALNYWGSNTAMLIQRAPDVELWQLGPADADPSATQDQLEIDGKSYRIVARKGLTNPMVHGLGHIRASLLRNAAYDWDESADDCQPDWRYVFRFQDGDRQASICVSLDCPRAGLVGAPAKMKPLSLRPIAERLRPFLEEQFPSASPAADKSSP